MPAKTSDDRKESSKRFHIIVNPAKDPEIVKKLSSVHPVSRYLRQLIRNDLEGRPVSEPAAPETPPARDRKAEREVFRENFTQMLESSKVSNKELAASIHVTSPTVSSWKAGESFPHAEQLVRICRFFGISRSELLKKGFYLEGMDDLLLRRFHALSVEGKRQLMAAADALMEMYPDHSV